MSRPLQQIPGTRFLGRWGSRGAILCVHDPARASKGFTRSVPSGLRLGGYIAGCTFLAPLRPEDARNLLTDPRCHTSKRAKRALRRIAAGGAR